MADVEVVMNIPGCDELRNSLEVQALVSGSLVAIASQARASGCECTVDVRPGRKRAQGRVRTANQQAAKNNSTNNTLLKSLDAGRF